MYPRDEAKPYGGAPRLEIRLDPDVMEWVRAQGGASWVRRALRHLRELSTQAGFARHWKKFTKEPEE